MQVHWKSRYEWSNSAERKANNCLTTRLVWAEIRSPPPVLLLLLATERLLALSGKKHLLFAETMTCIFSLRNKSLALYLCKQRVGKRWWTWQSLWLTSTHNFDRSEKRNCSKWSIHEKRQASGVSLLLSSRKFDQRIHALLYSSHLLRTDVVVFCL